MPKVAARMIVPQSGAREYMRCLLDGYSWGQQVKVLFSLRLARVSIRWSSMLYRLAFGADLQGVCLRTALNDWERRIRGW